MALSDAILGEGQRRRGHQGDGVPRWGAPAGGGEDRRCRRFQQVLAARQERPGGVGDELAVDDVADSAFGLFFGQRGRRFTADFDVIF